MTLGGGKFESPMDFQTRVGVVNSTNIEPLATPFGRDMRLHTENKVKGINDVRFRGQADWSHGNGCEYNRKRGEISKDRKEKIDIKKQPPTLPSSVAD